MTETSEMLVMLEGLYKDGEVAAQKHFEKLIECAKAALPEFMWHQLPKAREEVGGLFTASSKSMYLLIFKDMAGYTPMQANFKYVSTFQNGIPGEFVRGHWEFENFALELGVFGRVTFEAYTLADAVLLSRNYDKLKPQAGITESPMPSALM